MARRRLMVTAALLIFGSLQGCGVQDEPMPTRAVAVALSPTAYVKSTFPPPTTSAPPTPTNTREVPIPPTITPGPSPTTSRLPARTKALVVGIQDSRTIEVVIEGQSANRVFTIRLLGVEPPLLGDPWTGVAFEWLAGEVGRQVVVLESDEAERDAQGNLLRYVWKEGRVVNATMVQLGLATTSEDVAGLSYATDLMEAEDDAQNAKRGLWGPPPTLTPTPVTATATLTTTLTPSTTLVATQALTITLTPTSSP